jgi:hypothetical protein
MVAEDADGPKDIRSCRAYPGLTVRNRAGAVGPVEQPHQLAKQCSFSSTWASTNLGSPRRVRSCSNGPHRYPGPSFSGGVGLEVQGPKI